MFSPTPSIWFFKPPGQAAIAYGRPTNLSLSTYISDITFFLCLSFRDYCFMSKQTWLNSLICTKVLQGNLSGHKLLALPQHSCHSTALIDWVLSLGPSLLWFPSCEVMFSKSAHLPENKLQHWFLPKKFWTLFFLAPFQLLFEGKMPFTFWITAHSAFCFYCLCTN